MDFWLDGPTFGQALRRIEGILAREPEEPIDRLFADWPLTLYAHLYVADLTPYPKLQARLPKMPAEGVQRGFNGSSGTVALQQAASFVQSMAAAFRKYTGRDVGTAKALDYGVGWGRILRVAIQQIPETQITGCDAWVSTIEIAKSLGFKSEIVQVPMRPEHLPFPAEAFDLVWMSSLFTHFTADLGKAVLKALHPIVSRQGVLTVTIWTPECFRNLYPDTDQLPDFDWVPATGIDPKFQYGNTRMSLDYVRREWTDWELLGTDIIANDPKQFMLFLRPK